MDSFMGLKVPSGLAGGSKNSCFFQIIFYTLEPILLKKTTFRTFLAQLRDLQNNLCFLYDFMTRLLIALHYSKYSNILSFISLISSKQNNLHILITKFF